MLQRFASSAAVLLMVIAQITGAIAQESNSHLVIFIPSTSEKGATVEVKNGDGKLLRAFKWYAGLPFYKDLILPTDTYKIIIPGPISSITLSTDEKIPTFFQVKKYSGERGEQGVQITSWRGQPSVAIETAISDFKKVGAEEYLQPTQFGHVGNVLLIGTEPPWPGPFGPDPEPKPETPQIK
jgi:hypothetical protein